MGKIELDHTGSGSGITLSSDGTDLLLNGTAIGGGGGASYELYAENPSTPTAPTATGTNAVAIGDSASSGGLRNFAVMSSTTGDDAIGIGSASSVTGNYGISIGRASTASTRGVSIGQSTSSSGNGAVAIGYQTVAAADDAVALGQSRAGGADSFAAAIANNTSSYGATGANSVAIGDLAKATNTNAVCISNTSTASGTNSAVLGGSSGTASGSSATVLGGSSNVASGVNSTAKGYYGNTNGIRLKHATGVYPNMQGAYYVLAYATTDATPIALNTDVWTPTALNQIILPNNSAYAFHGTIVARQQASAGTACAAWKIEGLIRREGSAGTTVLVNSATTVIDNTPSWGMALSADTTNGGLAITVTGAAATNIRWVATIHTSEVTY